MFDRRVINCHYSKPPVLLFQALASIMHNEDIAAGVPYVCPDGFTIRQTYGTCPAQVGGDLYWRVAPCGTKFYVFDPEMEGMMDADEKESWEWCDVEFHGSWPLGMGMQLAITDYITKGE